MNNGSMQFLGRQLTEQAKAMGTLVEKMGEMVQAQRDSIPKYVVASDVQKLSTPTYVKYERDVLQNPVKMAVYANGTVRIKYKTIDSGNYSILINGISVYKKYLGSGSPEEKIDITVSENDEIIFGTPDTTSTCDIIYVRVCYDEQQKPGGVIS